MASSMWKFCFFKKLGWWIYDGIGSAIVGCVGMLGFGSFHDMMMGSNHLMAGRWCGGLDLRV